METELKTLSEKIIKTDLDGTPIETAVIYKEDVKEFIKRYSEDLALQLVGADLEWARGRLIVLAGKELTK
jgi:hypothetical protein